MLAWVLWGANALLLAIVASAIRTSSSHGAGATLTLLREGVVVSLISLALLAAAMVTVLAFWRQLAGDRARSQIWVACGLSLLAFPATLAAVGPQNLVLPACQWSAQYSIASPDGQTYYILHAPPPLNGPGHSALARRKSATPLHFTAEILTDFAWTRECYHGEAVLRAAARDPDPKVRRVAAELVKSGVRLHRL